MVLKRSVKHPYIGALLNTAIVWLLEDDRTAPEDMARFFLDAAVKMLDA